jgi:hypothetical protein
VTEISSGGNPSGSKTDTSGPWYRIPKRRKETLEERNQRWQKETEERKAAYPHLYALGYDDAKVRTILRGPPKEMPTPESSYKGKGRGKGASRGGGNPHPGSGRGRGSVHPGPPKPPGEEGKKRKAPEKTGATPPAKKGPGAGSYSDAAKAGKERSELPHLLLVHTGKESKTLISEEVFIQLRSKINKRVLLNAKEEIPVKLQSAFIVYQNGVGKIGCLDASTAEWYKATVAAIDIEGSYFRAWGLEEAGEIRQARMVATGLEDFTPEEMVDLIKAYNSGLTGRISAMKSESYDNKQGKGYVVVFGIDDSMAESLMGLPTPWTVNLGSERREIKFSKGGLKQRLGAMGDLAKSMEDIAVDEASAGTSKDKSS